MFIVFCLLFTGVAAIYENCDFNIDLTGRKTEDFQLPGPPFEDKLGAMCRWNITSGPGTQITVKCPTAPMKNPSGFDCNSFFMIHLAPKSNHNMLAIDCLDGEEIMGKSEGIDMMVEYVRITPVEDQPSSPIICSLNVEP